MTTRLPIKTNLLSIVTGIVILLLQSTAYSQNIDREITFPNEILQNRLDRLVQELDIPGVIVGLEKNGARWIGCSGLANIETQEPLTVEHQYRLASVTKTFTAVLILKLAELGKLSLDDTLEQWLPGAVLNSERITISMMLNHTSGIFDYASTDESDERMIMESTHEWTHEEMLESINQHPPNFEPGTDQSYSNSAYYLLGTIAEKAGGDTVDALTQQYLFEPAGINRTRLTVNGALEAPFMPGYVRFDGIDGILNVVDWNFSWDWTAGSGVSTASDMLAWVRALFSGQILSQENLQTLTTPIPPSDYFAYGMEVFKAEAKTQLMGFPGINEFTHNGNNPGTFTDWSYFPDSDGIMVFGVNYCEYREEYLIEFLITVMNAMKDIYDATFQTSSKIVEYESYP